MGGINLDQDIAYRKLEQFSLLNTHFAFVDTEEHLADGLFIQNCVTVHFGPEYINPQWPYRVILCRVRKKDANRAIAALNELPRKMLLCGHTNYIASCSEIWEMVAEKKKGRDSCAADGTVEQAQ